jgi:extracellular factor (EF) 3-hydroxypalmitic acid methyl ester biosynthesis protein
MRHYEELTGAEGRQVFYRAQRYKAREIFRQALPDCAIDGIAYTLQDISLTGLGASAAPGTNDICAPGAEIPVQIALRGIPFFESRGEVVRVVPTPLGAKIGIRLRDRSINLSHLLAKYEETLVRADLADAVDDDASVSPEYRQLSADVVHLLRRYRAVLDRFEDSRPQPNAAADMLALCEERILPRWRTLWHRGNELVAPIMGDAEARRAAKRFTELVLTPDFMPGAIWRRSYEKPLGYPGDFRIMQMVYDWQREGARLFDRLVHRIGLDVAECIATRMVLMRQAIAAAVLERPAGSPARITSLGCGPAREVIDYLRLRELPRPVQFSLIDQDHDALGSAYENTLPEVVRLRGQASVNCLQVSFMQLLKPGNVLAQLPPQDLIYTVGLIDYLSARRAKALVHSLYARLAPGGTLIVGNMMDTSIGNLWPMEFLCDWNIIYRNEREMADLAAELGAGPVKTELDSTGRVCLVTIRKP